MYPDLTQRISPAHQLMIRRALRTLCEEGDGILAILRVAEWTEFYGNNGMMPRRLPHALCTVPSVLSVKARDGGEASAVAEKLRLAGPLAPQASVWLLSSDLALADLEAPFRSVVETLEDILFPLL